MKTKSKQFKRNSLLLREAASNLPIAVGYFPTGVPFFGYAIKITPTMVTIVGLKRGKPYVYTFDKAHAKVEEGSTLASPSV